DVNWDRIEKDDGATELLRHVRQKLGAQPIQDAGKYLAIWIFDLRRDTGEPMQSYISRDDEAYHDVVRGFDTEYFKKQRTARLSERAKEWNNLYGELNWFLYKIEQEGPEDAAEKAKELSTSLWRFVKTGLEDIPEHPDFGTDFNQAILLDQLRDDELTNRDKKQGKDFCHRERGRIHAGWEANSEGGDGYSYYEEHESEATYDDQGDEEGDEDPKGPLYTPREIEEAETAFAAQQRSFEEARDLLRRVKTAKEFYPVGPGLDPEAQGHPRDEAAGADSDVTDHPDQKEIAPTAGLPGKDAEVDADPITNEMSRLRLEAPLANKPVIKNWPKTANQKKQLDKAEDWVLMSVNQSSSKGFGILDVGATSGIMGVEAAENLRDIIYEQTDKNINMDVSQKSTFIFGDGSAGTCAGKATSPLMIAGVDGELEINILDADAPLLIGVGALSRLGAVIDSEARAVYFKKLGRRAELLVLPSGLRYIAITYDYGYIIIPYDHGGIIITWDYGGIIITCDYGDIILTNVMDIIRIAPYSTHYDIMRCLNREAKCRKAESQQVKLENDEMVGSGEAVPPLDSGAPTRPPTSTRPTQPMPPSARLIQHQDTRGNIFCTVEGSELDKSLKRLTDTFLLWHLPTWEVWSSKLLKQWAMCRRLGRVIIKVFLQAIDGVPWELGSIGLPVQLLPEKHPTWPAELGHRAKIEPRRPGAGAKQRSAASAAAREQNQELRANVETAKSDISTMYATVDAFAALSSEQIYEKLNMVTVVNHLKPLCKTWGLTQSGKKEEVSDRLIACINEQRGTVAATIRVRKEPEIKKVETGPIVVGRAIPARYTQMCQRPDCQQQRGIAKNEPIVKVRPFGWCHQACGGRARSAIFGVMCALTTFGILTMVEARAHEDSNLGQVCDEKGYHYERLGLFNNCDLSKPQGYHKAKLLLDERRPELLVSTPPCGPWSIMQNINQRDDKQKDNLRKKRLKSQRIFENNKRLIEHQVLHLNGSALAEQPRNSRSWQKTLLEGHYHEEIESSLRTEASGSYPRMLCRRILRALTKSQNHTYFEEEVVHCFCMAATQQPPTEPTPEGDETSIPPLDGKESRDLTSDAVKKLESYIRLVHTSLGHLPRAHLLRYVRDRGARPEVLRLARTFKCDACDAHRPPTKRPPASSAERPQNGHEVLFDAFSWIRRSTNANVMALAILGAGSDKLYVRLIDDKATKWFPWMGRPKVMRYDPAGSAISDEFREWIECQGVYCLPCAADAHWQIGKIERAIEAFKEAVDAFDDMISAEVPTSEMFGLQLAARNDLIRVDGFSPLQRSAGRTPTGTAVNLFDEPTNLPLISAELQDGTFSRDAQVRRMARLAHIQTENSDRVKGAEEPGARKDNPYPCQDEAAGTDLDEYSAMSLPDQDIDLEAMASLRSRREQPGTWVFGDVQKQLDTNEVIDLSNASPPTGEDLATDDGES
ncbi:unnamed protein product, partial [Prorocentrum cordatum]